MKLRSTLALLAVMAFGAGSSVHASAQQWGHHPGYLHAIQDLRVARELLSRWTPSEHLDDLQAHAIHKIDEAIEQLKIAAMEDGKNINDYPHPDVNLQPEGRFRQAHQALDRAQADIHAEEDNPSAREPRHHAEDDIHDARVDTEKIINHFHWHW